MDMDPVTYFKEYDFTESLVWRIDFQTERDHLEIILCYMGFVPAIARPLNNTTFQQPTDFRRLVFSDVTQLVRSDYSYKIGFRGFDPANFNFSVARGSPLGTLEIASAHVGKIVDARRTTARYSAEIQMGSFGTYSFKFGSFFPSQRLVKTVPLQGSKVGHFDYITNEKIDYDNPFSHS